MKKGKIIALALAAGITFMGAGYAAWTDSVQINTTVKTGNLDVDFVIPENIEAKEGIKEFEGVNYSNLGDDIKGDDMSNFDHATFSFDNLKPGESVSRTVKLKNTGTVETTIDLSSTGDIKVFKKDSEGEYQEISEEGALASYEDQYSYEITCKKGENEETFKSFIEAMKHDGKYFDLKENEVVEITIKFGIKNLENQNDLLENCKFNMKIAPIFKQFNMN